MQNNFFLRLQLLVCLVFLNYPQARAEANELWQQANNFYQQQQYDSAQKIYLQLLATEGGNFQLYYNLGNSAYRLQQTDSAILFYEKSLLLNPKDEAAKQNLLLAQSRIVNPLPNAPVFFFTRWWNQLITFFSPNVWAWISFGTFLVILGVIYAHRRKNIPYIGRWLSLGIVVCLLLLCLAYFSFDYSRNSGKAVVMDQPQPLLDKPMGKTVLEVPKGTVVLVIAEEAGFFRLRLPNGSEGWLPESVLAKI